MGNQEEHDMILLAQGGRRFMLEAISIPSMSMINSVTSMPLVMATVRILPVGVGCCCLSSRTREASSVPRYVQLKYSLPAITKRGIYFNAICDCPKMMTRLFPGRMDRYARRLLKSLVGFSCDTSKVKVQIVKNADKNCCP